jgi:cytochrome oxidase Cu insertion factor (SCO1/SenC/PrrC family)
MFKKNFITIDPKNEKEKYFIYSELKDNGRVIIDKTDDEHRWWRVVSKEIGQETRDMEAGDKKFVHIASNYDHKVGVVVISKDFILKEEPKGDKVRFIFNKL